MKPGKSNPSHCLRDLKVPLKIIYPSYVFQEETAPGTGTPHLQGVFAARNQVSFSTARQWNLRLHLEATRDIHKSVQYCSDANKRTGRIWSAGFTVPSADLQLLEQDTFYPWQVSLTAHLETVPDKRSVRWYYDPAGGAGKTEFCRFYIAKHATTLYFTGGTSRDISYQVMRARLPPRVILINFTRQQEGKISYSAIESIKDGLINTTKYEGGTRLFPHPHIVIFSNWLPDLGQLTQDRWHIYAISGNDHHEERMFQ